MHNKPIFRMGILETPNCLFCKTKTETIEHIYIECDNVKSLWRVTEDWVRIVFDAHFKISDIEKIFGENNNISVKQLIILSDKGAIYLKRKTGKIITLGDLKRRLQKN